MLPYKDDPAVAVDDHGTRVLEIAFTFEADVREFLAGGRVLHEGNAVKVLAGYDDDDGMLGIVPMKVGGRDIGIGWVTAHR